MTYVVVENCIKCKYMDCVEVCPVDCFYEGENMLVIHPDECIDCGVCEPECPAEAIKPDTEAGLEKWLELNADYAKTWANITVKKEPRPTPRTGTGCRTSSGSSFRRSLEPGTEHTLFWHHLWYCFWMRFRAAALTHSLKSHDLRAEFPFYVGLRL